MELEKNQTCCFIGHKAMIETDRLLEAVRIAVEKLITEKDINTFLFSGKTKFDNLCFYIVSDLKMKYPHIRRIKANVGFPIIGGDFSNVILEDNYDDVYYPGRYLNEKDMIYRGQTEEEIIELSGFCIIYDMETDDIRIERSIQ